ncbi:MAG: hypothetical protein HRU46_16570, partial [Verrucomicrobiales bacterium]|nr:hypothetical protein [Verrucomicrobiales bacterium]
MQQAPFSAILLPVTDPSHRLRQFRFLALLGPGLMLAATGVGAGDLAGAAFAGMNLGVAVLWAVAVGAF